MKDFIAVKILRITNKNRSLKLAIEKLLSCKCSIIIGGKNEKELNESVVTISSQDQIDNYSIEFLNSLEPTRTAAHNLPLKLEAVEMLLYNLSAQKLCDGTRHAIKCMISRILEATFMSRKLAGDNCFIPRIFLTPTDLPFEFKLLQFPVWLHFAMTNNKYQRHLLKVVGVNLIDPVFSHD